MVVEEFSFPFLLSSALFIVGVFILSSMFAPVMHCCAVMYAYCTATEMYSPQHSKRRLFCTSPFFLSSIAQTMQNDPIPKLYVFFHLRISEELIDPSSKKKKKKEIKCIHIVLI
jgi:hypothetical protein